MSNAFSKEERVAFESLLEGFNDAEVLSRNVSKYSTDASSMERSADTIWRPQPYIATSYDGMDQSLNFGDNTQLSVPATLGYSKSVPWVLDSKELRDALQENRLGDAAKQKLASDINVAITNVACLQGTLVVKRGTPSGFADVAACDTIMNQQGIPGWDRYLGLESGNYNAIAGDLAARETLAGKALTAYERARIGMVSSFDTYKLDYSRRIAVAGGGVTKIDTQAAATNFYVPKATSTASTGEVSNVDNRYQTITVDNSAGVVAGDCFTISGVEAVHHITKQSTGALKTYRVISVPAGGTTLVISPPIISNQGSTDAEAQYQNCIVTPAAAADIVWLNTVAAPLNPFWQKDAIEILPGRYAVPADSGAAVMRGTTDNGIEIVLQKQYDINTMKTKFRLDTLFGVVCKNPEMAGVLLLNQS